MAKRKKQNSSKKKEVIAKRRKIYGLSILAITSLIFIACFSYFFTWKVDQDKVMPFAINMLWEGDLFVENWLGRVGALTSHALIYLGFGVSSLILLFNLFDLGRRVYKGTGFKGYGRTLMYSFLVMLFSSLTLSFIMGSSSFPWGGAYGDALQYWLSNFLGEIGLFVILLSVTIGYLVWLFNPNWDSLTFARLKEMLNFKGKLAYADNKNYTAENLRTEKLKEEDDFFIDSSANYDEPREEKLELDIEAKEVTLRPGNLPKEEDDFILETTSSSEIRNNEDNSEAETLAIEINEHLEEQEMRVTEENDDDSNPYDPTLELSRYQGPPLEILKDYNDQKVQINRQELEENKDQIVETLLNYKIEITKIRATVGPTVTLYEIVPAPGIRISKIRNLEDDIALSLAALGIRIIAPLPGRGTIGIEVPNKQKQTVALKDILASDKFVDAKMELPIALGKTISNEPFVADLAKMPHLLIAGATGQGKSVGINSIIASILYKKHPSQVKLVLIDPKKVELSPYSLLENHFLACIPDCDEPIITEMSKVIYTLNSLCIEMDNRYNLLKSARVRNLKEYNQKFIARQLNPEKGHQFLPYIVLVIDEFADLIMTAGKEVETPIARLAQLARAVGIHLIIATQRPSVNIITGIIKANFPARIAFKVSSTVDSRTILDTGGADQLIGRGDMLLSVDSDIKRIQGAFVDTDELEDVIKYIYEQPSYSEPYFLPEYDDPNDESGGFEITADDLDDYFDEAAKLVFATQSGSTSMLQRKFRIGYNRAGRIVDQLEHFGIVGEQKGSKAREVLIYSEDELMTLLEALREQQSTQW